MQDIYLWIDHNPEAAVIVAVAVVLGLLACVNWDSPALSVLLAPVAWVICIALMVFAIKQGGA